MCNQELAVNEEYIKKATAILKQLKNYLSKNQKVARDLRLYWPLYKGILLRIKKGKKYNGATYDIFKKIKEWEMQNNQDPFLEDIYDVIINNIILTINDVED